MVARRLVRHVPPEAMARLIYGSIVGVALVLALERHHEDAATTVVTLVGTGLAVALAELYSDIVASEVRTHRRLDHRRRDEILLVSGATFVGVAAPAVFFVAAESGGIELDTAFTLAKWSGLALSGTYGYGAARIAGSSRPHALLQSLAIVAVAAALILLKSLWH